MTKLSSNRIDLSPYWSRLIIKTVAFIITSLEKYFLEGGNRAWLYLC